MSQQVPPNNGGVPQENGSVVPGGGYVDAPSGYVPQGAGPVPNAQYAGGNGGLSSTYGTQSYARHRAPMIDPIESAKLTPQLLVLLVFSGLKRHWKWSLPLGLFLGLAAAGIIYVASPVQYDATATIQIRAVREFLLIESNRPQGDYQEFVNTQLAHLRSSNILESALLNADVARLHIVQKQRDKKGWLTSKLRVANIRNSEIVNVSIATDSPDASEKIVNAVVDAYFNFLDTVDAETNRRLLNQLRVEERRQRTLASNAQMRIRDVTMEAAKQGVVMSENGMGLGIAQSESLARDVAIADAKLTAMESNRQAVFERMQDPSRSVPLSILIQFNPEIKFLNDQRETLVRQRESRRQVVGNPEEDSRIRTFDRQIDSVDDSIRALATGSDSNSLRAVQDYFKLQEEVNLYQAEQDVRVQQILVQELTKKYNEQLLTSVQRSISVLDATNEQTALNRANSILDLIEKRLLEVSTEQRAPGRITQLTRATPSIPVWWRQYAIIGGGAMVLACLPLLLSIAVERMRPRLYHVSQVRRAIQQVLIGEIMEPPVSWVHGATFRKRLARYRESVHNWCTHLLLSDPFRTSKTLSIASVAGDDGKTFLAVQIAVAMAQMREGKVLLIDGDMRVGRLHLLFGNEEGGIGLADVLSFRNGPGEAIVESEKEPNLGLISAGQLDVSPYELLGDGRFRDLLDVLEQNFSLIIVVLPPVAHAAESLIMAASTDSTLLCVRQGETVLAAMEDVYRKLVNTGASVDGIVVKDIPYYQMAGRDGGFADRLEQIRLSHLLQYAD